jgi:molecular chaperone Hsp33
MTPPGEIARCILEGGAVRVVVALTTPAAREAARRHDARGAAALALARGTTAGLLLSTLAKDRERVTLQILGDGPFGGLTVDAHSSGHVRAYLKNPAARLPHSLNALPPIDPFRQSLAAGVGSSGIVSVVRDLGLREAFRGQTALSSGEIDEDVERYLTESEQIDSALACDAMLEGAPDAGVAISGGILVQALPGSDGAELVDAMRLRLRGGAFARALGTRPPSAEALALAVLGPDGSSLQLLDSRTVAFHCPCSRERAGASLALLGSAELGEMILEDVPAEVTCNFCRERYLFDEAELEAIRRGLGGPTGAPS